MFRNFNEIEEYVLKSGIKKKIALAAAHDGPALSAVVEAKRKGVAEGVLIGKEAEIREMLKEMGESEEDYKIVDCPDDDEAAKKAVGFIHTGEADLLMKGILQTSTFAKAILNKETGLMAGGLLSYTAIFHFDEENRFVLFTDPAVNVAPNKEQKIEILKNALPLAKALGIENPKVAMISAVEKVSPKVQSTVDAAEIAAEEIPGCIVEGPLAFDGAISKKCAEHKGIKGEVAGSADILVMPNICSGNVFYKTLTCVHGSRVAGGFCGASVPVIVTSRGDDPETKYYSVLLSVLQSIKK